jgi:TatD DNase family protein
MIFDTHIHLNDEKLINNLDEYINNANKLGITNFLCVGWDVESSKKAIEIAHKYNGVYAAVAVMPTEWKQYNKDTIPELRELAKDSKVVAIGEIGLDYYWEKTDEIKAIQKEMFIAEIKLANELNLPVSIHCRDAYQDCLEILKSFHVKRKSVMHCYSGSLEMGREFIKNNFVLAFGGTLTYKNSLNTQKVFDNIEVNNIVFETDAPYLTPQKYRGQTNIPQYIYETVLYAANRKNMNIDDIENITYETSRKIFSRENYE